MPALVRLAARLSSRFGSLACYVSAVALRRRGALGAAFAAAAFAFAFVTACGSERPPALGTAGGNRAAAGGPTFGESAISTPPGCGVKDDGEQCGCVDVPLFVDAPTIYFVLDRSGSMAVDDKWTQTRIVVGNIMRGLGPRAKFGAAMFPMPTGDNTCVPGEEIMSVRPGDPPSSNIDGPTTTALLAATRVPAQGGTPTSATLGIVRRNLESVAGRRFVILATDGAPNCNPSASCGADQCQLNIEGYGSCSPAGPNCCAGTNGAYDCNDIAATLGELNAMRTSGVLTYVVGLPGSTLYANILDQMALAGGTALPSTPRYFAVAAARSEVMLSALKKVAAKIAGTCDFTLQEAPENPNLVNVYIDDVVLPFEPVNGWTIEDAKVTLVGQACERVKSGDALNVRIITGCPRVEPR